MLLILLTLIQPLFPQQIISVTQIGQLTGQPSINNTGTVNVYGTDLGYMFLHSDGKIYFLFGDTFGPPGPPGVSGDWRSNTMAFTSDTVAADGILFDGWITDASGFAKALVEGNHDPNDGTGEVTKIPSAGWSVQNRQYMWFMSVKQWLTPGHWDVNFAEIAYSDDNGNTYVRSGIQHPANSNFIQVAEAEHGGYLYFWGIPAGRFGGVKLARVIPSDVLDSTAYRYYTGSGWSANESDAVLIVAPPVGELSVVWNHYLQRWLMMYLNENTHCIEARLAEQPEGPWGQPLTVACSDQYPALYGAFMHNRFMENNGETVYFLMSQFGPYNVFLMKVVFQQTGTGINDKQPSSSPHSFTLHWNSPNPFNSETVVSYQLAAFGNVKLAIYNLRGQAVRTLVNKNQPAGRYTVKWDGKDDAGHPVGSGIYLIRLIAGKFVQTRKAVLLR